MAKMHVRKRKGGLDPVLSGLALQYYSFLIIASRACPRRRFLLFDGRYFWSLPTDFSSF